MNYTCQPIKDMSEVKKILQTAKMKNERLALMMLTQLNLGLRISDIVPLKVNHFQGAYLEKIEKKTGKRQFIKINQELKFSIDQYIIKKKLVPEDYIFKSRQQNRHITPRMAQLEYQIIREQLNIPYFSTHSLRKTFGYFAYKNSKGNLPLLMQRFNHNSQDTTLRYIGITQDQLDDLSENVQFSF